ncbi:MAG TPA: hypothetical protein VEY11_10030 [Pyrinomonadaceae bacterium]|nr:hypothetical protein [Pyrinomonadaceae bacterium]
MARRAELKFASHYPQKLPQVNAANAAGLAVERLSRAASVVRGAAFALRAEGIRGTGRSTKNGAGRSTKNGTRRSTDGTRRSPNGAG